MKARILGILFLLTVLADGQFIQPEAEVIKRFLRKGFLQQITEHVKTNEEYITTKCALDVISWQLSLLNSTWGWKMHDATGKFPSGLLRGNVYSIGQYDECMTIDTEVKLPARRIKGKYCAVNFSIKDVIQGLESLSTPQVPNSGLANEIPDFYFNLGICIPHRCPAKDIGEIVNSLLSEIDPNLQLPKIYVNEDQCKIAGEADEEWDSVDIAAVVVFSCFAFILLLSTLYDVCSRDHFKDPPIGHSLFVAFSMYTNGKNLIKPNNSPTAIKCINGIRVFSLLWVILCHRYSTSTIFPVRNWVDIVSWVQTYISAIIVGGTVAVDSFFVMSGFLLSYVYFNQVERLGKKSFNIGLFYLHRFLRLWPASAAIIFFLATLFKHLGDGPFWPQVAQHMEDDCHTNWWKALIFVNNYVSPNNQCAGHLWYVAVDFQLYILSPILIVPLIFKPKLGIINMVFWILVQQVTLITIVYLNDWGIGLGSPHFKNNYYFPTHMRAAPWLLAFAAGYFFHKSKDIKFNKKKISTWIFMMIGWAIALAIMCAVIFGQKPLNDPFNHTVNKAEDGTFNAFARTGWALGLIWIIFACHYGFGGPINWFLSLYYWEVIGKLTFSIYLTHTSFQMWYSGSSRVIYEFAHLPFMYVYFGDIVMSVLAAFFWAMAFEFPFLAIERVLLRDNKPKITPKDKQLDIPQDINKITTQGNDFQDQDKIISSLENNTDQAVQNLSHHPEELFERKINPEVS